VSVSLLENAKILRRAREGFLQLPLSWKLKQARRVREQKKE